MKRAVLVAAAVLAGCGSEERAQPEQVRSEPGRKVFSAMGCGSCHALTAAGSTSTIGPNLDNALNNRPRDAITQAIVNPPSGSIMPEDFGTRMSKQELDQLVDFLVKAAGD